MKVGIMQPYFVPYLGYWQLMNAVDVYVMYDDVNYIKGGWINRNMILVDGRPQYFNLPIYGASSNKLINEILVNHDPNIINKNLRIIQNAYKKAPYYSLVYPLIKKILMCNESNIASFINYSFSVINEYIDIKTKLIYSSSLNKDNGLKGQDKVIAICQLLGASEYYNAIGGQKLYTSNIFDAKNIKLGFVKTNEIQYRQFDNRFCPNLSIVDVMMFNSKEEIADLLAEYTLLN